MNFLRSGARLLARGARKGNPGLSALGTALVVAGWLRRRRGPQRRLLYARTLRPGEALGIRMLGGNGDAGPPG